jgi:hypothetical protein
MLADTPSLRSSGASPKTVGTLSEGFRQRVTLLPYLVGYCRWNDRSGRYRLPDNQPCDLVSQLHIKVVAMQSDTAIAVGRARKERARKLLRQPGWTESAALGFCQDCNRYGWSKTLFEEPLMRRRVIELNKCLVSLFQRGRGGAQRKLIVVQASLNVEMRLVRSVGSKRALALRQAARHSPCNSVFHEGASPSLLVQE